MWKSRSRGADSAAQLTPEARRRQHARLLGAHVRAMRAFLEGADGKDILIAEREMLTPLFERCFGFHSLCLGPGDNDLLSLSPIRHAIHWAPEPALAQSPSTLICPLTQLALPDESMDMVMIHHLLEVAPEPHRLLREAARVLRSSGCLIIVAWQPMSGEGLLRLDPRRRHITPWEGSWRTRRRSGTGWPSWTSRSSVSTTRDFICLACACAMVGSNGWDAVTTCLWAA
ncbi:methyltransferase domain-containing protein [Cobetia marina]